MGSLTIRIDSQLEADLQRVADAQHRSKSEVAREMLRRNITTELFHLARQELMPHAEKAGWLTDEDVFREIS